MSSGAGKTKTVYVLGAGFTRAFLPEAPLLVDRAESFGIPQLLERIKGMPSALLVVQAALNRFSDGRVNVEELLTRLDGRMPYDSWCAEELRFAAGHLKRNLLSAISFARKSLSNEIVLRKFAAHCLSENATCVTFNYDDLLDEHLYNASLPISEGGEPPICWNPTYGYGFVCQPSETYVRQTYEESFRVFPWLLKLHGSVNWFAIRGTPQPYGVDSIKHHEDWWSHPLGKIRPEGLQLYLEIEPFIVPPVLGKSQLSDNRLLELIWWKAHWNLQMADKVVFIGYSLPVTDIAAKFLFRDGLWRLPGSKVVDVQVIDWDPDNNEEKRERIRNAYRDVHAGIPESCFHFDGAVSWLEREIGSIR